MYESQIALIHSRASSPNMLDDSIESSSDSEVFTQIENTYKLVGVVKNRSIWCEPSEWVVEIQEKKELEKLGKPGLTGISGVFKYDSAKTLPFGSRVQVEITYNNNGGCLYEKNKIISLAE